VPQCPIAGDATGTENHLLAGYLGWALYNSDRTILHLVIVFYYFNVFSSLWL